MNDDDLSYWEGFSQTVVCNFVYTKAEPLKIVYTVTDSKPCGPFWRRRKNQAWYHTIRTDIGMVMENVDDDTLRYLARLPGIVLHIDVGQVGRLGL